MIAISFGKANCENEEALKKHISGNKILKLQETKTEISILCYVNNLLRSTAVTLQITLHSASSPIDFNVYIAHCNLYPLQDQGLKALKRL